MAQGKLKLKAKKSARVTKKQQNPRPAAPRIYTAKLGSTLKQLQKLTKAHLAKLVSLTEKLIAGRVGHLELIKGSRREVEKAQKEQERKAAKKK